MRKIVFILLFFVIRVYSQEYESLTPEEVEYNTFLNYIPKFYTSGLDSIFKKKYSFNELNTLSSIEMLYCYQEYWKLNQEETKQLEEEINQITVALYLENKPVLIRKVGGLSGCPDEMIFKEVINQTEVVILNFCYTCSGMTEYEKRFMSLINNRTEKLLGIVKVNPTK